MNNIGKYQIPFIGGRYTKYMAFTTKVQGTKYTLQIDDTSDGLTISMMIDNVADEKINLKNKSLKNVKDAVNEILALTNVNMNDFQIDLMAKDLYGQLTGDEDLSEHKKSMANIEDKKNMMQDPKFQSSLVSEFRSSFQIKEESTKVEQNKRNVDKQKATEKTPIEASSPQVKAMVSEINQELGTNPSKDAMLNRQTDHIDTRISSVDVGDLINELKETKELLEGDLARVQLRMEKMDNIILKLSSLSSKL